MVTDEVGGSALFAARFRECAARALLLPRRDPKSRSPLWQQRMRSAQLLTVAAQYPEFPIVLETMRECLTDVFDLDGLLEVQRQIASRSLRLVEVETKEPSPFAKSLLFGYVGAFVYEGDVPLAEKKAAALSLDATLLAELLGKDGLKQLLDAEVIAEHRGRPAGPQRRAAGRHRRAAVRPDPDGRTVHPGRAGACGDPRRLRADFDPERAVAAADRATGGWSRCGSPARTWSPWPRTCPGCGTDWASRCRRGWPPSFTETATSPIDDLVLRWARTHGPFAAATVARRYGLGRVGRRAGLRDLGRTRHVGRRLVRRARTSTDADRTGSTATARCSP